MPGSAGPVARLAGCPVRSARLPGWPVLARLAGCPVRLVRFSGWPVARLPGQDASVFRLAGCPVTRFAVCGCPVCGWPGCLVGRLPGPVGPVVRLPGWPGWPGCRGCPVARFGWPGSRFAVGTLPPSTTAAIYRNKEKMTIFIIEIHPMMANQKRPYAILVLLKKTIKTAKIIRTLKNVSNTTRSYIQRY